MPALRKKFINFNFKDNIIVFTFFYRRACASVNKKNKTKIQAHLIQAIKLNGS